MSASVGTATVSSSCVEYLTLVATDQCGGLLRRYATSLGYSLCGVGLGVMSVFEVVSA